MNTVIIGILVGILGLVVFKLLLSIWPRHGKMGINLEKVHCPKCGEVAPTIRKPANLKQMLWGGWSCKKCGCEFDKYGNQINT